MKKFLITMMTLLMTFSLAACGGKKDKEDVNVKPDISQAKAICELSVMDCYYHNVAKYYEEDATGAWFWAKDKKFWIEYSGVVTIGVDASLVTMEVDGTNVTITIPEPKVLECEVDESSLTKDSFIIDDKSADITAEDQTYAFEVAQEQLRLTASSDTALLAEAKERTKQLLEDYVNNIGDAFGIEYTINWVYLDADESNQNNNAPMSDVIDSGETK